MKKLNIEDYKRKKGLSKELFIKVGNILKVKKDATLLFPVRFTKTNLANLAEKVSILSNYCVIDENNNYGVVNIPAFINLEPTRITTVDVDGKLYYSLFFEKDSIFTTNVMLVKYDGFLDELAEEYIMKGNVPWYYDYEDVANILIQCNKFSGNTVGDNPLGMEVIVSIIARLKEDKKKSIRHLIKSKKDLEKLNVTFVGLMDVFNIFDTTISKVGGSYLGPGLLSSINTPQKETSKLESIIRA